MAFNLRPFGNILATLMYKDSCTISRLKQGVDEYGATIPDKREVIHENIKCKLSFTDKDAPGDGNESYMPVLKQVVIFLSLDYNIIAGDYVVGQRFDETTGVTKTVKGICGEPNRFDTHQEIPIQIEEEN